jgi:hypothetical protein
MAESVLISEVPVEYSRNPDHAEVGEDYRDMPNVMVMGLQEDNEHGLDESLAEFRKHHADVGDKLLNISQVGAKPGGPPLKLNDPRPALVHTEWPYMLYKPGEDEPKTVHTPAEMKEAREQGWRDEPVVKPQVAVLDPQTEKKMLLDANKAQQAQITLQSEMIEKQTKLMQEMTNRLDALETTGRKRSA